MGMRVTTRMMLTREKTAISDLLTQKIAMSTPEQSGGFPVEIRNVSERKKGERLMVAQVLQCL
jgi:hypothetical protein